MGKKRRGHGWSSVSHKRSRTNKKFSPYPKRTTVGVSTIPNAGFGLFLLESVKEGERIAVYSGKELTACQLF